MHAIGMQIPAPDFNPVLSSGEQIAVLAGGCFWGVQGVFQHVHGVLRVRATPILVSPAKA